MSNSKKTFIKIVRYETPEDINAAFLHEITKRAGEGNALDEADVMTDIVTTEDGQTIEISEEMLITMISTMPCWGFSDSIDHVIHYWARKDCDFESAVSFFAHEIGHLVGRPCENTVKEEARADMYATVALQAMAFGMEVVNADI